MRRKTYYIILGINERDPWDGKQLYWNNKDGWVYKRYADVYTEAQMKEFEHRLPIGGKWKKI